MCFQFTQITIALIFLLENQFVVERTETRTLIISGLLLLWFSNGTLLVYHAWLMAANVTTCNGYVT
jgi:hypothetical protein